jgi:hypothetical protein
MQNLSENEEGRGHSAELCADGNNVKMYLTELAQHILAQWWNFISMVMNLWVSIRFR